MTATEIDRPALERVLSTARRSDAEREALMADPGFGRIHTDHMVAIRWNAEQGWHDAQLKAYEPLQLDPSAMVLHYGQAIFEGLKAYRQPDGGVAVFRPEENARRFNRSAARLAMPELPVELFLEAVDVLVDTDRAWVPSAEGQSLYLRPFMFAKEAFLGVRSAEKVNYYLIGSPAGAYFPGGVAPVSIWLSTEYSRAGKGGTGAAKTGGNYAASLAAQREAIEQGCDQVVFLDDQEFRYIEELGGMNLFFVYADGHVVTPETGTILEGITRASIIELAGKLGHAVEERKFSIDEWRDGVASGRITEVFACGTAAVVTPIGRLAGEGFDLTVGDGSSGPVTTSIRSQLTDIQYGRTADPHGWMHRLV